MADKYDSYLTILHQLRQIKGALRQAAHKPTLVKLQRELSFSIKEPHPYRLVVNGTINQIKPLLAVPEFKSGATGSHATPGGDYIYNLTSLRKVVGDAHARLPRTLTWTHFPPAFPNLTWPDRKLFECLLREKDDVYGGREWIPLKDYATGRFSVKREFTWWTNQKFPAAHVVCAAHRVGMPNTWIPKYALVMRCPAKEAIGKTLPHVPTVMDGFVSEIFSPADYRTTRPVKGEAINLDSSRNLFTQEEEYSLNPIPVELIEFQPVLIDRKKRQHAVYRNARLWQLLEIYYHTL
jgi:hypothetical protein